MEQYHTIPQPDEISKKEKEDAMGAYLMMFASIGAGLPLPIINLIASLVYHYIQKKNSLFVRFHSLQSLLSQLPVTLLNASAVYWAVQIFLNQGTYAREFWSYLLVVATANLVYFIFSIIGAVKARKGQMYYLIFFGRLSYDQVFKKREEKHQEVAINQPPK